MRLFQFTPLLCVVLASCLQSLRQEPTRTPQNENTTYLEDIPHITQMNGELSDFWAEEQTGIDLARVYFKEKATEWEKATVGIVDAGLSPSDEGGVGHGELVARTMQSGDHGSLVGLAKIRKFGEYPFYKVDLDDEEKFAAVLDQFLVELENFDVDVWNFSNHGFPSQFYERLVKIARKRNLIIVTSADNLRSMDTEKDYRKEALSGLFVVSGMTPVGLVGGYSTPMKNSTLAAPADNVLTGNADVFGGTSASAPLVAGVVTAVRTLLPKLPFELARDLLLKSAIPTLNGLEKLGENGRGSLNAFLALRVAERVRESCSKQLTLNCYETQLKNADNWNFPVDTALLSGFSENFPSCASTLPQPTSSDARGLTDASTTFHQLRSAHFLNPRRADLTRALSCAYARELKLPVTATFYGILTEINAGKTRTAIKTQLLQKLAQLKGPLVQEKYLYVHSYFETLLRAYPSDVNTILQQVYLSLNTQQKLALILALDHFTEYLGDDLRNLGDASLLRAIFKDLRANFERAQGREAAGQLCIYTQHLPLQSRIEFLSLIGEFFTGNSADMDNSPLLIPFTALEEERLFFSRECKKLSRTKQFTGGLKALCEKISDNL